MHKTTVRAGSNIAFIKYWGVADPAANLPLNSSISMTLADAHTTTTVMWDSRQELADDEIVVNDRHLCGDAGLRIVRHLDRIRTIAGVTHRARIHSRNNFPIASGIASSASGFAALTVAGCRALELDLNAVDLSALSRHGSGSASRSLFGGFVHWDRGSDPESSVARQLFAPGHWQLIDVVAVVSTEPKQVSSEGGHSLAATSPLNEARVMNAEKILPAVVGAIRERDLERLGTLIELDALAMHAVMMTSTPSLVYWLPGTIEVIQSVRRWREEDGLCAYFTIDAGPNVHVICETQDEADVRHRLSELHSVRDLVVSGPGPAPQELDQHLF
jgi:diphosphomevalonate decarboxylase